MGNVSTVSQKQPIVSSQQVSQGRAYVKELSSTLLEYRNDGYLCDVILVTGQVGFLAHSIVLAAASPVFKTVLEDGPPENGLYRIHLHEYDIFTVELAVHFIYTGFLLLPDEYKKDLLLGRSKENRVLRLVNSLEKIGIRKDMINKCEVKFQRTPMKGKAPLYLYNPARYNRDVRLDEMDTIESKPVSFIGINAIYDLSTAFDEVLRYNTDEFDPSRDYNDVSCMSPLRGDPLMFSSVDALNTGIIEVEESMKCEYNRRLELRAAENDGVVRRQPIGPRRPKEDSNSDDKINVSINNFGSHVDIFTASELGDVELEEVRDGEIEEVKVAGEEHEMEGEVIQGEQFVSNLEASTPTCTVIRVQSRVRFINSNGKPPIIRCPHCQKKFRHRSNMQKHVMTHLDEHAAVKSTTFNCEICSKVFKSWLCLNNHMANCHTGEKPSPCTTCGKVFSKHSSLRHHMERHREKRPFLCHVCGMAFTQKPHLMIHVSAKHHREQTWNCTECDTVFNRYLQFKKHCLREHNMIVTLPDPREDESEQEANFTRHLCETCGKALKSVRSLALHMKMHANTPTFTCDICNKVLSKPFTLRQHRMIHTGEHPFECKACKQKFRTKQKWDIHMTTHSTSHSSATGFKLPIRRRSFPCRKCGKDFASDAAKLAHSVVHTGVLPFKCNVCQKEFSYHHSLSLHNRMHSNTKEFECATCGHAFRQQAHLKCHMLIHTGQKPYPCQMCSKAFKNRVDLRNHYVRWHQVNIVKETVNMRSKYTIQLPSTEVQLLPDTDIALPDVDVQQTNIDVVRQSNIDIQVSNSDIQQANVGSYDEELPTVARPLMISCQ